MTENIDHGEPGEGLGKSGDGPETTQNEDLQNKKSQNDISQNEALQTEKSDNNILQNDKTQVTKPRRPTFERSNTADSVLANMSGDPKTTRQLEAVMSQLDPEGKAQLAELASRFASGARRKGRVDEMEAYREQNPWHDSPRERPVFSLGEPFPRRDGIDQESPSVSLPDNRTKDRPVFSLGEPLPRKVRRVQREGIAKQKAEDDIEQGLRQRPQRDQNDQTTPDSDKTADTDETLQGNHSRRQSMSSVKTQKTHRGSQDQGTDTAQQFRVSDAKR